jgi:hypothetical protein
MQQTKNALVAMLALLLSIGSADAQSSGSGGGGAGGSGGGGAGSGTSSGTGGTTSPGVTRGAPAVGSTPTGPVAPNRSNSEVFPPSRLAPRPPGSIQDPSTTTTRPSEQNGMGAQDPAALGTGRVPSPATGGINSSAKTPRGPSDSIADCQKLWGPGTQMSKTEWEQTCRRAEDNLGTKQ